MTENAATAGGIRRLPIVVVGVMDRDRWDANTDNLVVVDPVRRRLLWVPRDLWSRSAGDRINAAWARGGTSLLLAALAEHGIEAHAAVCVRRSAVARLLDSVEVTVPVDTAMSFLYPRAPEERLQDGAVVVRFEPPAETLSGVRVHQWLGARRTPHGAGSDLHRLRRQCTFVRAVLGAEFAVDFGQLLRDPDLLHVSDPAAIETLARIDPTWDFEVLDTVLPRRIDGKDVLVPSTAVERKRHLLGRVGRRLLGFAAVVVGRLRVPTGGWGVPRPRTRLLAIIAVRDEERYLPGWLANVAPHVDGVIVLDDGSTDRSPEILEAHPLVLTVLRRPHDRAAWDEVDNHRLLVRAAVEHGATWIVALDADERVERTFRARAERAVRRGRLVGLDAFAVPMFELWGSAATWRADGRWGRKRVARLFAARTDHAFDVRPLHAAKAPLQGRRFGGYVTADVRVYHLRMVEVADRAARRARYERLDPHRVWQPIGYDYLTDESALRLRRVPRRRGPLVV